MCGQLGLQPIFGVTRLLCKKSKQLNQSNITGNITVLTLTLEGPNSGQSSLQQKLVWWQY